jgi:hypothetical protein
VVPGKTNMATLEKEEREKPIELYTLFGALFIIEIFQPSVLMFYLFIYIYSLDPLRFFFFLFVLFTFLRLGRAAGIPTDGPVIMLPRLRRRVQYRQY